LLPGFGEVGGAEGTAGDGRHVVKSFRFLLCWVVSIVDSGCGFVGRV